MLIFPFSNLQTNKRVVISITTRLELTSKAIILTTDGHLVGFIFAVVLKIFKIYVELRRDKGTKVKNAIVVMISAATQNLGGFSFV